MARPRAQLVGSGDNPEAAAAPAADAPERWTAAASLARQWRPPRDDARKATTSND